MKAASVNDIKQALKHLTSVKLVELCLRLARYKKENKELLTFLLFEANDLEGYIKNVKKEIDDHFAAINTTNLYFVKKSLRKILRIANKYIRYTGSKEAEVELLIYFCTKLKSTNIPIYNSTALTNLYNAQIKKINATIASLHEDLQYDYKAQLDAV